MAQSSDPASCPAGHDDTVKLLSAVAVGGAAGAAPAPSGGGGGGGCCGADAAAEPPEPVPAAARPYLLRDRVRPSATVSRTLSMRASALTWSLNSLIAAVGPRRRRVRHPAVEEHVVRGDDPALPHPGHQLLPVRDVAALVRVQVGEVDVRFGGHGTQGVQGGGDPQVDPVRDAGLLPGRTAVRRPLLRDVTGDQRAVGGQRPGHRQGAETGERADLHHVPGAHQPDEEGQQRRSVPRPTPCPRGRGTARTWCPPAPAGPGPAAGCGPARTGRARR